MDGLFIDGLLQRLERHSNRRRRRWMDYSMMVDCRDLNGTVTGGEDDGWTIH